MTGFITNTLIEQAAFASFSQDMFGVTGVFVACSGGPGLSSASIFADHVNFGNQVFGTENFQTCPGGYDGARTKIEFRVSLLLTDF